MRVILISPPDDVEHESLIVNRMFENNLALLHLRKPGYGREEISAYLNKVNPEYHSRIVIHSCYELLDDFKLGGIHLKGMDKGPGENIFAKFEGKTDLIVSISCHSIDELMMYDRKVINYAFLSPVFDSISKENYKAGFDHKKLAEALKKIEIDVIALGGCRAEYSQKIKDMGFAGAAFLGAVWNSADPLAGYLAIEEARRQLSISNEV